MKPLCSTIILFYLFIAPMISRAENKDLLTSETLALVNGFKNFTVSFPQTGTEYQGNASTGNKPFIMRRDNTSSGIVITESPGKIQSVNINFSVGVSHERTLEIWGKISPYTSSADLYDKDKRGTLVGEADYVPGRVASVTIPINGLYQYIGLKSKANTLCIDNIEFVWEQDKDIEIIEHNVSTAGYSTLYYSDFGLVVPNNVEAYTYQLNGERIAVSKAYREDDVIPVGEAVVVKAPQGTYYFKKSTLGVPDEKTFCMEQTKTLISRKTFQRGSICYRLTKTMI